MPELAFPSRLGNSIVKLRAWGREDVPEQLMGFADPSVLKFSWGQLRSYTEDDAHQFFLAQEASRQRGEELNFALVRPNDVETVIGGGSLYDISMETGRAAVGYWLTSRARGNGYATAATRLMASYALDVLDVGRLELTCAPDNSASIAVAERCGFTREGVLREHIPFKGTRRDTVMFSLLPGDVH